MSAGWEVGDLVVCVDASPHPTGADSELELGREYLISRIVHAFAEPGFGVHVDFRVPQEGFVAWHPKRFCRRLHDELESCESEFVTLLQRIKRKETVRG